MLSHLRFPDAVPSLVALALVVPLLWFSTRPGGSHVNPIGAVAGEMAVTVGTLALAVVAIIAAPALLVRPSPALVWVYPWIALAIVAGNGTLWLAGYWRKAEESHYLHYVLAPWLAWISIAALAPTCVGQILHFVHRRRQ